MTQPSEEPDNGLSGVTMARIALRSDAASTANHWKKFMDENALDFCLFKSSVPSNDASMFFVGAICQELFASGLQVASHSTTVIGGPPPGAPPDMFVILVTFLVCRHGLEPGKRLVVA